MKRVNSLNHTRWECKHHTVFIPKYRNKVLFGQVRKELSVVFHRLARRKESLVEEGHQMADHVHMMISIPPKYAVSQVVGFIKGKSAIQFARTYVGPKRNYVGRHLRRETTAEWSSSATACRTLGAFFFLRAWHSRSYKTSSAPRCTRAECD